MALVWPDYLPIPTAINSGLFCPKTYDEHNNIVIWTSFEFGDLLGNLVENRAQDNCFDDVCNGSGELKYLHTNCACL